MPRFGLYDLSDGMRVVDLQSDFLGDLGTRLVAPLIALNQCPSPAKYLNPVFTLENGPYALMIQSMAAVPVSVLGALIGDLSAEQDQINRALDMVFQGL